MKEKYDHNSFVIKELCSALTHISKSNTNLFTLLSNDLFF